MVVVRAISIVQAKRSNFIKSGQKRTTNRISPFVCFASPFYDSLCSKPAHTHNANTKQYKNGPFVSVVCSHNSPFSIQTNVKCFVADLYIYIYFVVVVRFYFICFIKRIGLGELKKTIAKSRTEKKLKRKKIDSNECEIRR